MKNQFDNEIKYKLFRSVREVLHPTISKKNISDYRIIISENILPMRIFYPKKITGLEKVILFINGNGKVSDCDGKYSNICRMLVKNTNYLVIAIEYKEEKGKYQKLYKDIFDTIKYLYKELERNTVDPANIILMGDSTAGNIITGINYLNKKEINIKKEVLFYPVLDVLKYANDNCPKTQEKKYYDFLINNKDDYKDLLLNPLKTKVTIPDTLLLVGNSDILKAEAKLYKDKYSKVKYIELPFSSHGFLNNPDKELEEEFTVELNKFLN